LSEKQSIMMAQVNPIKAIVKDYMKTAGFRCKRNSWYRQCNDLIQIVNIQKSCWGNQYYVNIGFDYYDGSFKYPSEYKFPAEYMFDLRIRIEHALENADLGVFDFDRQYEAGYRESIIMDYFVKGVEYLNKNNTTTALKEAFSNKPGYIHIGPLRDIILG